MTELTSQQKQAVESIGSNVLVSAGAGSGKTHVLVERYIEILKRCPDVSLSGIIAVTYTRKAASEMRARLKGRMEELMKQAREPEDIRRWSGLRAEVDGARIGTIHSLCEWILKSNPAEAAIDPKFEVVDEIEMAEILDASMEEAILQSISKGRIKIDELLRAYPIESIKGWLSAAIRSGPSFADARQAMPVDADKDWLAHWQVGLEELKATVVAGLVAQPRWRRLIQYLESNSLKETGSKVEELRARSLSLAAYAQEIGDRRSPAECFGFLKEIAALRLPGGKARPEIKLVKEALKELKSLTADSIEGVPVALNENDSQSLAHIRALFGLLEVTQDAYAQAKQHGQMLDFNDLIVKAYELLASEMSSARLQLHQQLKAILVDEFQDTNRLQSDLIALMCGSATRLFLIGDDKQSIYKFQGADVSTFDAWRKRMEGSALDSVVEGGCHLTSLTRSFRSHPHIVGFVNGVFDSLFYGDEDRPPYEARFQALQSFRTNSDGQNRVDVVVFDCRDELGRKVSEDARRFEAEQVVDWIAGKVDRASPVMDKSNGVDRPIKYGDFAILVQRNQDFYPLERALAERGVPSVTMGGSSFLERQEVYDMENALRFLASPEDDLALVGVLRSPMFACSDDLLHALPRQSEQSLWHAIKSDSTFSGDASHPLGVALGVLSQWRNAASVMPVSDVLRTIIETTRYDIVVLGLPDGRQRARNLYKLVSLAEEHRELTAGEFADRLYRMRQQSAKQTAAPVDSGNSVKLMTIHSSKGLEFPAVVLPVMGVDAGRVTGKLLFHRDYGVAFDSTRDEDEDKPASWEIARFIEKKMAEAEKKRLLYVAMTRARDYLALFIERGDRQVASFKEYLRSSLAIDTDEAVAETGVRYLSASGEAIPYNLMVLDGEQPKGSKNEISSGRDSQKGDSDQERELSADLLDLYDRREPYGNIDWMQMERVTPVAGRPHLDEALVGMYFHLLMERLTHRLDVISDELFDFVALEKEIGMVHPELRSQLVETGKALIDKFQSSSLFALMSRAGRRIHEVPYLAVDEDIVSSSGRPDLLFSDETGKWHVVDFKTDTFDTAEIDRHAEEHREQLSRYVKHIQELTGIDAVPSIYFARYGILHHLSSGVL